ncbi:MAG: hypothetical protein OYH77_02350 [Pseudomonadota bacterium]|nr:hypothetical protein [Pseudomonadota bacterium]
MTTDKDFDSRAKESSDLRAEKAMQVEDRRFKRMAFWLTAPTTILIGLNQLIVFLEKLKTFIFG